MTKNKKKSGNKIPRYKTARSLRRLGYTYQQVADAMKITVRAAYAYVNKPQVKSEGREQYSYYRPRRK